MFVHPFYNSWHWCFFNFSVFTGWWLWRNCLWRPRGSIERSFCFSFPDVMYICKICKVVNVPLLLLCLVFGTEALSCTLFSVWYFSSQTFWLELGEVGSLLICCLLLFRPITNILKILIFALINLMEAKFRQKKSEMRHVDQQADPH